MTCEAEMWALERAAKLAESFFHLTDAQYADAYTCDLERGRHIAGHDIAREIRALVDKPTPGDAVERVARAIVDELGRQDGIEGGSWALEEGKLAFLDQADVDMHAVARAAIASMGEA